MIDLRGIIQSYFNERALIRDGYARVSINDLVKIVAHVPLKPASNEIMTDTSTRWRRMATLVEETPYAAADESSFLFAAHLMRNVADSIEHSDKNTHAFCRTETLFGLNQQMPIFMQAAINYHGAAALAGKNCLFAFNKNDVDCMDIHPSLRGEDAAKRIDLFSRNILESFSHIPRPTPNCPLEEHRDLYHRHGGYIHRWF